MISEHKKRRTVTLWDDTSEYLDEFCEVRNMSLSELMEEFVDGLKKGSILMTFDASTGRHYFGFLDDDY